MNAIQSPAGQKHNSKCRKLIQLPVVESFGASIIDESMQYWGHAYTKKRIPCLSDFLI